MPKLNEQQKEFFAAMEGCFETTGWSLLKKGWKTEQSQLAEAMFFNAKSMDDVLITRVRHGLLNELIQLPEQIAAQKLAVEEGE